MEKQKNQDVIQVNVGNFDFDSAIGKLEILKDKKIISGLEYVFTEIEPAKDGNGNPTWRCQCKVDGVKDFVEYENAKKMLAKKAAAFTMLQILTIGKDEIFEKHVGNTTERGVKNV